MAKKDRIIKYCSFALISAALIAAIVVSTVSCNYVRTTKYTQAENTDYYSQTATFENEDEYRKYITQKAEDSDSVAVLPEGYEFVAAKSKTVWVHEERSLLGTSATSNLLTEEEIATYGDDVLMLSLDLALSYSISQDIYYMAANAYWQVPASDKFAGQDNWEYAAVTLGGRDELSLMNTDEAGSYGDGHSVECAPWIADTNARVIFFDEYESSFEHGSLFGFTYLKNISFSSAIKRYSSQNRDAIIRFAYAHTFGPDQPHPSIDYSVDPPILNLTKDRYWIVDIELDGLKY